MGRGEDLQLLREVIAELNRARELYVADQVSRQLAHREGDMTRAQVDNAEIEARVRWGQNHPAALRLMKREFALHGFAVPEDVATAHRRADRAEEARQSLIDDRDDLRSDLTKHMDAYAEVVMERDSAIRERDNAFHVRDSLRARHASAADLLRHDVSAVTAPRPCEP